MKKEIIPAVGTACIACSICGKKDNLWLLGDDHGDYAGIIICPDCSMEMELD